MADYLARVATAGARTAPPARPPVTGPPRLPEMTAPALAPTAVTPEAPAPGEATEGPPPPPPVLVQSPRPLTPDAPTAACGFAQSRKRHRGLASPTTTTVRMPTGLRPAATSAALPTAWSEATTSEVARAPSGHATSQQPVQTPAPSQPSASAVPQATKTELGVAPASEAPATSRLSAAETTMPTPAPRSAPNKEAVGRARLELLPRAEVQPPVAPSGPLVGDGHPQAGRLGLRARGDASPTTTANFPVRGESRQARLTIGRIDVQVHNQPAAPPAAPQTPAETAPRDVLEQHYLERFRLRL